MQQHGEKYGRLVREQARRRHGQPTEEVSGYYCCNGCIVAMKMSEGKDLCAFCRTPYATSDEEHIKRLKKLMAKGNGDAFSMLASYYARGIMGMPQDQQKANELLLKAGELG